MTAQLDAIVTEIVAHQEGNLKSLEKLIKRHPKPSGGYFSRSEIIRELREKIGSTDAALLIKKLRLKPIRSLSGVTPVTVLTKPWACPGDCIFCPSDIKMPKSYLSNEPGAQRAAKNYFDPYLQAYNRLSQLHAIGHPVDKVEYIVLGGTWSVYPLPYRIWFIKRLFDALNEFGQGVDTTATIKPSVTTSHIEGFYRSGKYNHTVAALYQDQELAKLKMNQEVASWAELDQAHQLNETAKVRCVGLVLETRPDNVTLKEATSLRKLGATKIQIGVQTLSDENLKANKRGHTVKQTRAALNLLRQFGFKLHIHWMPNLLGASPESDQADYLNLYLDESIKPDEIKIYPTSLIPGTELVAFFEAGKWQPYTYAELREVLSFTLTHTPRYTRITRMIRDIPSTDILVGNKFTNFRQIAQNHAPVNLMQDIRAREIRNQSFDQETLKLKTTEYKTTASTEIFFEFTTPTDQIVAFLRLSLPVSQVQAPIKELVGSALIREVHVYGQMVKVSGASEKDAQHLGLGKSLIRTALELARDRGFNRVSVISAIGTKEYYRKLNFIDGKLYQHISLMNSDLF